MTAAKLLDRAAIEAEWTRRAEESLRVYIRRAWPVIEPATEYLHNWHIDAICDYLEAVTRGEITRLLINMPPRYMKSIAASVLWPTWEWIRHPHTRWLFASYSSSLSTKHSVDRRTVIESRWYRDRWGDRYQLSTDQNVKTEFQNTARGVMVATSVGGSATGKGGDRVVVDDPHNPEEAQSDLQREAGCRFFSQTLSSRLNDKRRGAIVVIMQRLHEADVSSLCIDQGYVHLKLPAEAEERQVISAPGGHEYVRELGDLLWPEREGPEELAAMRVSLGSYGYAGQYQQRPAPAEGGIFRRDWFRGTYARLPEFREVYTVWDTALKDKEQNDETASLTLGAGEDGNVYLLRLTHGRWETPDVARFLVEQAQWLRDLYGDRYTGDFVEDTVSGTTLLQYVRRSHPELVLIPVKAELDKVSRARGVTPLCESGRVLLPDLALYPEARGWTEDLLTQVTTFPNARHDDMTDVLVYGLKRYLGTLGGRKSRRGRAGGTV